MDIATLRIELYYSYEVLYLIYLKGNFYIANISESGGKFAKFSTHENKIKFPFLAP